MAERSRSARTRDQGALRKEKNKKAAQDDEVVDQEGAEREAATRRSTQAPEMLS